MFLLFVGLVAVFFWVISLVSRVNRLDQRLTEVDALAREARTKTDTIAALKARVAALEAAAGPQVAVPTVRPLRTESDPPPVSSIVSPAPAQGEAVASPVQVPSSPPAAEQPPPSFLPPLPPSPPAMADDDAWEVKVGGNWLSKVGVLVLVIGLSFLIGYSVTHVGPAGRIGIGLAVSLSMLATGVMLERRTDYRTYAHALIAGGWAGVYFTTYAMRAIEPARVLDSDLVAVIALSAVAAAMVWHSLRYRSQEVTALAYVVAYATLALTPLHLFSLAAAVPLAISILVVAQRFTWPRVQVLGVVATYGLFILRGQTFGFGAIDASTFTPYLALGAYWLVFEAADVLAVRRRQPSEAAPPPMFLLNAAGLAGSGLLQLPMDTPVPLSTFLLISGAAYLVSAVLRARLSPSLPQDSAQSLDAAMQGSYQGSYQGAAALAVAFVVWAIELRLSGERRVMALLFEAELVFLSGLVLRDWVTRGLGSAVAVLVGVHAIWIIGAPETFGLPWRWEAQGPAGVAALVAIVWYANREWLRSRGVPLLRHEWLFTPVATYVVVLIARAELQTGYSSLAALVYALPLLEAGLRRGREYRYQAYVVGASSSVVLLLWFGGQAYRGVGSTQEAWSILLMAMTVAYLIAWRISPPRGLDVAQRPERAAAAAVAGVFGTAFVVMLEWIVIAPEFVALAWAATAITLGVAGLHWKVGGLRWQVYPLLALALLRALKPILESPVATTVEIVSALVVIGFLYAFSLAVRGALAHTSKGIADVEDAVRVALSVAATLSLVSLIYCQVRPTLVTVTWGAQAALLLAAGFPARERLLRLSGLAVLVACIGRLFVFDLPQLEELARIISFVALGAVLLAVSWIYTRYRARIQKYL